MNCAYTHIYDTQKTLYLSFSLSGNNHHLTTTAHVANQYNRLHYHRVATHPPDSSPPDTCDKDDYPEIHWWGEDEWNKYEAQQKDRGKSCKKLNFICNEDGITISEDWLKAMTDAAKQCWNETYHKWKDPTSWRKKLPGTAAFFSNSMRLRFPEFCWCEDDWKVERFATIRFPDWCWNTRGSAKGLTRLFLYLLWNKILMV